MQNQQKIINNTAGEIRFLQITDKTSSEKLLDISKSSQAIIPGKEFAVKKAIEIKPNGKVNYQFSFWIWSEIQDIDKLQFNEGFLFSADRFVNDLNITFLNNSGNALTAIVWREQEGNLGEKEIKSIFNSSNTETTNQSLYFPTTNLRRGERVSLGLAINKE